ncbi:hypothetical protein [Sulfurimonas xiamenensis]|uniref:Uncharacterized protein n=1 Tax=Sulfurimonas xiamenensis TaxID=2590021 RepID=A0AAJ4A2S7_9BACT|nr:hypothetical protein [Sulfurimonas xiamenensis]QFR42888.1 hypothetical protein FJR47_02765 [Sulfurimonas xiamenensis]
MNKIKVGYLLNEELKKAFKKKIVSDESFSSMSEALDFLTHAFISEYELEDEKHVTKIFSGFEIQRDTKETIEKIVANSYEFDNATDFINRVIYEYVKDDIL